MTDYRVFNDTERAIKSFIYGQNFSPANSIFPVSVDYLGNVNVRSQDSQFARILNAERTPIIELKSTYGISVYRDSITTNAGGTVTNDGTEFEVSTDAALSSSAILDSSKRGRYIPGATCQAGIGVRLPSSPTGTQEVSWGYFDDDNGFFFGQDSTGIFVAIRRDGVTTKVYQQDWNADKLDGTGPSGFTLDLSEGNIFEIVYSWYGYGAIQFDVVLADSSNVQNPITVHRVKPFQQNSVTDPNLPVRAQASNGNSTDTPISLFVGGRQYTVFGRYDPSIRITSQSRLNFTVGTASFIPIITFRRKANFPASTTRANSVGVELENVQIITNQDVLWELRFAPTLAAPSYGNISDLSPSETAVEVAINSTTFTDGGEKMFSGLAIGGFFSTRALSTQDNLNIDFNGLEPVSLAMRAITSTATVSAIFSVREEW